MGLKDREELELDVIDRDYLQGTLDLIDTSLVESMNVRDYDWRMLLQTMQLAVKFKERLNLTFDKEAWNYGIISALQTESAASPLKPKTLLRQVDAVAELLGDDEECLAMLRDLVTTAAQNEYPDGVESLLCLLESFEKVGLKKVPERLQVLKELKEKIEQD